VHFVVDYPNYGVSMRRVIQFMVLAALVLDVVYWMLWFTNRSAIESLHTQAYYDFENAFPLADAWLGVACLMVLITIRRNSPMALFWLLAAGSAGIYLGCMDLLYDLEHGIFAKGGGGAFEAFIVVLTWAFSLTALIWSWRHRAELLSGEVR